jgi:4-hydroxybenzoate polyprenyltransferase
MIRILRTLLILGRVSTLPTVWSNCLAGWWLGGGGRYSALPWLLFGSTFLYAGGTFLNDAFDADFDQQHRRVRPIPGGLIELEAVRRLGLAWLAIGWLILLWLGRVPAALGLLLIACILAYNSLHRLITFSSVFLGICRFFLYVIAASVATDGVTGWSIWCGLAMACYLMGVGYFLPRERKHGALSHWPLVLLAIPVFLALLMNADGFRSAALLLSATVVLWVARSLRYTLWSNERDLARTISGLLAGIVFVDWLAAADTPREWSAAFIALFAATLLLQRFDPSA